MTEWYCYKDKVKMLSADVAMKYMQLVQYCARIKMPSNAAWPISPKMS